MINFLDMLDSELDNTLRRKLTPLPMKWANDLFMNPVISVKLPNEFGPTLYRPSELLGEIEYVRNNLSRIDVLVDLSIGRFEPNEDT